jgi:phage terminase small subunit
LVTDTQLHFWPHHPRSIQILETFMRLDARLKPPAHLRTATQKWFASVSDGFDMEEHHVRLLTLAGEAWDRCQQAREVLDAQGLTFLDRFNCPRARPEVAIERDARIAFARLLRELALDVEAPPAGARPPSLRSGRRR